MLLRNLLPIMKIYRKRFIWKKHYSFSVVISLWTHLSDVSIIFLRVFDEITLYSEENIISVCVYGRCVQENRMLLIIIVRFSKTMKT